MATKTVVVRRSVPAAFTRAFPVRRRVKTKQRISLAIVVGAAPGLINTFQAFQKYGAKEGARYATQIYTGYNPSDGSFHLTGSASHTGEGLMPLVAGVVLHMVANKSGLNRQIAKMKLPFGIEI